MKRIKPSIYYGISFLPVQLWSVAPMSFSSIFLPLKAVLSSGFPLKVPTPIDISRFRKKVHLLSLMRMAIPLMSESSPLCVHPVQHEISVPRGRVGKILKGDKRPRL